MVDNIRERVTVDIIAEDDVVEVPGGGTTTPFPGGEINTMANVGEGFGIYKEKIEAEFKMRTLVATGAATLEYSPDGNEIIINVAAIAGEQDYVDYTSDVDPIPVWKEGRTYYDPDKKAHTSYIDFPDVSGQLLFEEWVRVCNTGLTPTAEGTVIKTSGARDGSTGESCLEYVLADANDYDRDDVLAVTTMVIPVADPEAGTTGEGIATQRGKVRNIDTSLWNLGDTLWLSTTQGQLTNVRPTFPAKPIHVGHVTRVGVSGEIFVFLKEDQYDYEFDGCAIEKQDVFVTSDGTFIHYEVEKEGGGDLPVQLGGQVYLLDCTTGAGTGGRARVLLTPGTDTTLQFNFIYVQINSGVATLYASPSPPASEYAYIGYVSVASASRTQTDLAFGHQRSNDSIEHNGVGRIAHIGAKLRQLGSTWGRSGCSTIVDITKNTGSLDDVDASVTSGIVWQLHPQYWPLREVSVDGCYVANASGSGVLTPFQKIFNLNQCLETVDGNDISGRRYNLVLWGAINKESNECKLFVNLPTAVYGTDESAYYDVNGTAVTSVDTALFNVAFLIARVPLRHQTINGGDISFINPVGLPETVPLLGLPLGSSASGAAGGGGGAATLNQLTDVEITGPVEGEVLEYDPVQELWVNKLNNARELQGTELVEIEDEEEFVGTCVILNCDFEEWDSGSPEEWVNVNNPTLTEVSNDRGGNAVKIEYTDTTTPGIRQLGVLTSGESYRCFYKLAGDGSTGLPRIYDGGSYIYTGTASSEWDTGVIDFVASGVNIRCVAAGVTSPGQYALFDYIFVVPLFTRKTTDQKIVAYYYENGFKHSGDFTRSEWVKDGDRVTIDDDLNIVSAFEGAVYQGIRAVAVAGTHNVYQQYTATSDKTTYCFVLKKGLYDWCALFFSILNQNVYFDLNNGAIGTNNTGNAAHIKNLENDEYLVCATFDTVPLTTYPVRFYLATGNGEISFTGDDSSTGILITAAHIFNGIPENRVRYIKTNETTETGIHKYLAQLDPQIYYEKGWVRSITKGYYIPIEDVEGDEIEETAENLVLLEKAGKEKRTSDDTWGTPVDNVEYYSGFFKGVQAYHIYYDLPNPNDGAYVSFPTQPTGTPKLTGKTEMTVMDAGNDYSATHYNNNSANLYLHVRVSGGVLQYFIGTSFTSPTLVGSVRYTKV